MANIYETLKELTKDGGPSRNAAGYITEETGKDGKKGVFHYIVSDNLNRPAAAYVLDFLSNSGTNEKVYTNLPDTHWIKTWTQNTLVFAKEGNIFSNIGARSPRDAKKALTITNTAQGAKVDERRPIPNSNLYVFGGSPELSAPLAGGLFDAANRIKDTLFNVDSPGSTLTGKDKGFERALSYYMLAGYAVLGACASAGYDSGNYIAAMMVDDSGKILSYGVNSGRWHHGEVNMLLNYFSKLGNVNDAKFADKTIVFSTLTPCEQCSGYLESCRPSQAFIYIGQEDPGPQGSAGAKDGKGLFLNQKIKSARIYTIKGDKGSKAYAHSAMAKKVEGVKSNVAKEIGTNCANELKNAKETLEHKFGKTTRTGNTDVAEQAEQDVKKAVLNYLQSWLATVSKDLAEKKALRYIPPV